MATLLQDVRYAARSLLRTPGPALAAVVCFALGIGANVTIFGVVDTLMFRPPAHVERPDQVVRLYFRKTFPTFGVQTSVTVAYPLYTALRDSPHVFAAVAAFTHGQSRSLGQGRDARSFKLSLVSSTFFPLLGVHPALGRFFEPDEDRQGAAPVVVLSHGFWRQQFGGDPGALGRRVLVGHSEHTVIGVAPEGFTGVDLENIDAWVPIAAATPELMGAEWLDRNSFFLRTIGRLRSDVPAAQAAYDATMVYRAEDAQDSIPDPKATVLFGPVQAALGPYKMSPDAKVSTWLAVVTAIVLLIACANVANILLVRGLQRRKEIAIRLAMGARRWDLVRPILNESALLAVAGGGGSLLVALWAGPPIRIFLLGDVPAAATAVDGRMLIFTAATTLIVTVLAGLVPALQSGRADLVDALKSGASGQRYWRSTSQTGLLVGQVALTLTLLVGAGLFTRSLLKVRRIDLGFDPERLLMATMDLDAAGFRQADANALYLRMLERVRALPGVTDAAASVGSPFVSMFARAMSVPGRDSLPIVKGGGPYRQAVTPGYFATMGTRVRGRDFTTADAGTNVAIVDETMARLIWPGEDPIDKCIQEDGTGQPCLVIIGVAQASHYRVVEDPSMVYYTPLGPAEDSSITSLLVRVGRQGQVADVRGAVRREMQSFQANLPSAQVVPFDDLLAPGIRSWRLGTTMFGLFALLALVLAAVGFYGVLAYTVAQRTHDIGVRMALGAQRGHVLRLVVDQGLRIAGLGIVIGAIFALLGGRAIAALLYGVTPHDPLVLGSGAGVLLAVAALASYFPARRATEVDPMTALRHE